MIEVPLEGLIDEKERQGGVLNMGIKNNLVDPNRFSGKEHRGKLPNQNDEAPFVDDLYGTQLSDQLAQKGDLVNERNQKVLDFIEKYYKGSPVLTIHADKFREPLNVQEDDNRFYLYIQAHSGKADKTTEEYRLLWKSFCKELVINKFGIEPKDIEALKQEQDPPFDIDDPDHEIDNGVILTYNSAYTEDGSVEDALHHLESDTFTLEIPSCFDQPERLWFVKEFLQHFAAKLPVKED